MIPSALDHVEEIAGTGDRSLAVFLDYDGTLAPIVSHPEKALLPNSVRQAIRELSARTPVAVLTGRDLDDVRQRVNVDRIIYAGSHGFDIAGPRGLRKEVATEFLTKLDMVEKELGKELAEIPGAHLERKRFSIAAHYRNMKESDVPKLERVVSEVAARHPELRTIAGKKVYELQPNIDWDKGRALMWLLESLRFAQQDMFPIYIGDDLTDEDAFRAVHHRGAGIVVSEQPRPTAASYSLKDPKEVERFLRKLVATLT